MSQLELLGGTVPVEPDVKLTERQRHALEIIGRYQPIPSDELGAHLHQERAGRGLKGHPAEQRCEWCGTEGAQMGAALRKRGLVTRKRDAGWVLPSYRASESDSTRTGPNVASDGLDEHGFPKDF